jgi:hypothetical protein
MTTTYHPPIYYRVRSVVRWTFWTSIFFLTVVYLGYVVNTNKPDCDIQVDRNFTWSNPKGVDITACSAPNNVILNKDGTWRWAE